MTDEQVKMMLVLKYGSINNVIDQWVHDKLVLTQTELRILEDSVTVVLGNAVQNVVFKEHPKRVEFTACDSEKVIGNDCQEN